MRESSVVTLVTYRIRPLLSTFLLTLFLVACSSFVEVTKTGKGFHEATNPGDIEIIRTQPKRDFEELGIVTANGFPLDESAEMHNALRSKSALLGAHAIVILREGVFYQGFGDYSRWATGIAIRYK